MTLNKIENTQSF